MNIHVKRSGALGDVLLTTPIIRKLRELNPNASIYFYTDCPQVYHNNPNVNSVLTAKSAPQNELIDLDMVYENNPKMHIIDSYAQYVFGIDFTEKETELFVTDEQKTKVDRILSSYDIDPKKAIVCHLTRSWESRTMPLEKWKQIIDRLIEMGYQPIIIGSGGDMEYNRSGVVNLKGRLSIHHINYLCSLSHAFIGMDSGMFHVAGATPSNTCKLFGIFTCAESQYRIPFRENVFPIHTEIDCYGCLHRVKPPVTFIGCERGDNACVELINIERILLQL